MRGLSKILMSHGFVGVVLLALLLAFYASENRMVESLRYNTFDLYQRIAPRVTDPATMDARVVIVDIDDPTLAVMGQWPWPRTILADLVQRLMDLGVLVVGFDAVFPESDRTSPAHFAAQVKDLPENVSKVIAGLPDHDQIFADVIKKGRVVLGQAGDTHPIDPEKLPKKAGFGFKAGNADQHILAYLNQYPGLVTNIPQLEEGAPGLGLFSIIPDDDGMYRRIPLVDRIAGKIYPSLALEMLRVALGGGDSYMITAYPEGGIKEIMVKTVGGPPYKIPTDKNGRVWVHYAKYDIAPPRYISAKDILQAKTPEEIAALQNELAGTLAIVGTSAIGLKDIRPTPIDGKLPGVEVHLQALETILAHAHLTRTDEAVYIEAGMIVLAGIMLILLVPRLSAIYNFLLSAGLIAGLIGTAWHYYTAERILVDASYPSAAIAGMFLILTYLNYMREEKERQQIKTAFAHYVSPALLDELAADPSKLALGGETRNITVMFSDIRGFTTISEQFDAHGLTQFINRFLTPMTDVILNHKGTIDKYMGDAIMAFWNAPLLNADHPKDACRAALGMGVAARLFNERMAEEAVRENRKHIPVNIGIGLNTGNCCVGNMGSDQRFDYSVLGDDVNLASRLEGQCKTYGVDVVLGQNTVAALGDIFAVVELDKIQVKGKTEPVTVYALLGDEHFRQNATFHTIQTLVADMLASYRSCDWDGSEKAARKLMEIYPSLGGLSELYLERAEGYRREPPPPGWNGVYVATSK